MSYYDSDGGDSDYGGGWGGGGGGGRFRKIHYLDDIPNGYRLLSCQEFLSSRSECLGIMGSWDICLLTDGKCDGSGEIIAPRELSNRVELTHELTIHSPHQATEARPPLYPGPSVRPPLPQTKGWVK
jgi:hypothetical protein